jgi:hypothetical protein
MPHRVVIAPTSLGNRGRQYAVTYSGKLLCESRTPVFAACRALLGRGITGRLEVCAQAVRRLIYNSTSRTAPA